MIAHQSLLKQYGTRFWYSDGKIIYLEEPTMLTRPVTPGLTPNGYSLDGMVIHAGADPSAKPDGEQIKRFMNALHEQAARAIGDSERPGYLQISVNIADHACPVKREGALNRRCAAMSCSRFCLVSI
jgi:hypothetical protein